MKALLLTLVLVLGLALGQSVACTRKKADPETLRLEKGVSDLETQEGAIDEKLKNSAGEDVIPLNAERALLKSRKERLKEILKSHASH